MRFKDHIKTYYHGSIKPLKIGTILIPKHESTMIHKGDILEEVLEKYRPKNKLSRFDAIFMVDNPNDIDNVGGYTDYIYTVQPGNKVEKSDLAWYSEVEIILSEDRNNETGIKLAAKNYWSGVQYYNKSMSVYEYRTESAKVIQEYLG